jgi:glycosyltransferase involved in cell wall biosynthesis
VQLFVIPDERSEPTGANLVNEGLVRGLRELGVNCARATLEEAPAHLTELGQGSVWIDSRYLSAFPRLREHAAPSLRLNLLAHSLPSWSEYGDEVTRARLTKPEQLALSEVRGAWVPSASMASLFVRLGADRIRVFPLEPGLEVFSEPVERPRDPLRVLMVANLLPGKGVAPFLEELASRLCATDALSLSIVGSTRMDPRYAEHVQALVARTSALHGRVSVEGSWAHQRVLKELRASHAFVSASRLESYGMALAEARAAGLIVLARAGGNVAEWIARASGGVLAADDAALATACVALSRDRALRDEVLAQAAAATLPARPWTQVAREFMQAIERLGL